MLSFRCAFSDALIFAKVSLLPYVTSRPRRRNFLAFTTIGENEESEKKNELQTSRTDRRPVYISAERHTQRTVVTISRGRDICADSAQLAVV